MPPACASAHPASIRAIPHYAELHVLDVGYWLLKYRSTTVRLCPDVLVRVHVRWQRKRTLLSFDLPLKEPWYCGLNSVSRLE